MSEQHSVTIEQQITAIIDEHVRPYIEMDGGTIEFTRYEDTVVYVRLAGACITCPSSSLTLKGGVERQIRRRLPEVSSVELEGTTPLAAPAGSTAPVHRF
jgi:Fe-S cluster biogenesis protein NfuA